MGFWGVARSANKTLAFCLRICYNICIVPNALFYKEIAMFTPKDFAITDTVTWNDVYPDTVDKMIEKYGPGPFTVVGLRLHNKEAHPVHPVAVMIELPNGERQEFAGEWFKKIPSANTKQ